MKWNVKKDFYDKKGFNKYGGKLNRFVEVKFNSVEEMELYLINNLKGGKNGKLEK